MAANERVSRSVALEQTYVHDVYEQYYDNPRSKPWPKISQFLSALEPGALVCDVGCGNGKYLKINTSIFNLGGEKSIRLSELARSKQNEVIKLDNLALPFRDNCLDAVLSISVVHHLATTERRVCALRELARVLRVGGRLVITVWAMEQSHRKFESQDVLVPWKKPMHISTSLELTSTTNTSEDDGQHPYHAYTQTSDSDSNKSFRFRNTFRKKGRGHHHRRGRSIDPSRNSSPGSSSLSSPNETCYSFVRRAIQKLAGGGRRVVGNRPWFLDSWIACTHKQPLQRRYDPDGCEYCECCGTDNVEDQPIELLRIDDEEPKDIPRRQTFPSSQLVADIDALKSRSMNNIRAVQENNKHRIKPPFFQSSDQNPKKPTVTKSPVVTPKSTLTKPKLVKQKKSVCDEDAEEALDQPTDMKDLIRALPDFKVYNRYERGSVLKQRSLNEEILSTDRLREKERLRQNIQKQTSLNEELIYKRTHTFDSLKDSFFAVTTSKRFQLIKTGITNRFRNSTTNMEKVTGSSLKNGFARIFQTWKGADQISPTTQDSETVENFKKCKAQIEEKVESEHNPTERRHSKEDGSDSSKDSSLQSDTSVDSEDSFASVIFVPKSDPMSPIAGSLSAGPASPLLKGGCQSAPQSPRIKQSSCPTSPRVKQMPLAVHPLTKQLSSPKPSTEFLSTTFFPADEKEADPVPMVVPVEVKKEPSKTLAQKYSVTQIPKFKKTNLNTPNLSITTNLSLNDNNSNNNIFISSVTIIETSNNPRIPSTNVVSPEMSPPENVSNNDVSRTEKLKEIREILAQKPGFGTKSTRSHCPIVRKISDADGKDEALAKPIPKLLKLDIFNPEEDDDSDSSCVSSPDSVDSVVSIKSSDQKSPPLYSEKNKFQFPLEKNDLINGGKPMNLLEAAANVASSLDEAVEKVIKSSSRTKRKLPSGDVFSILQRRFSSDTTPLLEEDNGESRRSSTTWNEECHKHLTAFADKLSEKLMKEIDEYQLTMDNIDDPYIHRLSEELHDLSKLSAEIKKQNEYLNRFSDSSSFAAKPSQKQSLKPCSRCKKRRFDCECKTSPSRTKNRLDGKNEHSLIVNEVLPCKNGAIPSANVALSCKNNYLNKNDSSSSVKVNGKRVEDSVCGNGDQSDKKNGEEPVDSEVLSLAEAARPAILKGNSTDSCDSSDKGSSTNSVISSGATSINFGGPSMTSSVGDLTADSKDGASNESSTASLVSLESRTKSRLETMDTLSPGILKKRDPSALSDLSQDSLPSDEVGGEITYHRYYHVFREGELDQLIDKYVDNLHIVSSTYEHSSWCIIAEKVQVWTI